MPALHETPSRLHHLATRVRLQTTTWVPWELWNLNLPDKAAQVGCGFVHIVCTGRLLRPERLGIGDDGMLVVGKPGLMNGAP